MRKANIQYWRPLCLIPFMACTISVSANGLSITNVQRDSINQTVSFDIQWYNSWRVDSLAVPFNWDAAWVFVKFQDCDASPSDPWIHGGLNDSLGLHDFGSLEPVLSDGSSVGLDSDLKGVMLRRSGLGPGNHTLYYRVKGVDGRWSSVPNTISIQVNPIPSVPQIQQQGDTLLALGTGNSFQWFFNGNLVSGADSSWIVAGNNGNYQVITYESGCASDTSASYLYSATGLADDLLEDLRIYPNPTSGTFKVEGRLIQPGECIWPVYNELGQQIRYKRFNAIAGPFLLEVDLGDQAEGVCFLGLVLNNKSNQSNRSLITRQSIVVLR